MWSASVCCISKFQTSFHLQNFTRGKGDYKNVMTFKMGQSRQYLQSAAHIYTWVHGYTFSRGSMGGHPEELRLEEERPEVPISGAASKRIEKPFPKPRVASGRHRPRLV